MDRNSSGNLDELAHLRRTGLPVLGTQAIVIQRDCESARGVANETQLHAGGAAITAKCAKVRQLAPAGGNKGVRRVRHLIVLGNMPTRVYYSVGLTEASAMF